MNSFYKNIFSLVLSANLFFGFGSFVEAQTEQTFNFYRNLKVGDVGQDVLELQKILNRDSETRVANSGPGSIGNETNYFGNLTKNALIKYQNKYRSEILTPVGLSYGTGYFGPSTIKHIKNSSGSGYESVSVSNSESTTVSPNSPTDSPTNTTDQDNRPQIDLEKESRNNLTRLNSLELYFVSKKVFEPGDELVVVGGNISPNSEIYFKNSLSEKVVSSVDIDQNFINFDAPDLDSGEYKIYIKTNNFISNPLEVKIVDDLNPPTISSVSPSVIGYGDKVTIKGSNFENQNEVMTSLGSYVVNSNGSVIEFYLERPLKLDLNQEIADPVEKKIEGMIQIKNSKGLSDAEIVDFLYN